MVEKLESGKSWKSKSWWGYTLFLVKYSLCDSEMESLIGFGYLMLFISEHNSWVDKHSWGQISQVHKKPYFARTNFSESLLLRIFIRIFFRESAVLRTMLKNYSRCTANSNSLYRIEDVCLTVLGVFFLSGYKLFFTAGTSFHPFSKEQ